jgi:uncharacterized protein
VSVTAVRLWALALTGWVACFGVLMVTGAWTPFAFLGVALVFLVVSQGAVSRDLLRPSLRVVVQGVASGAAMVLATHLAYRVVVSVLPSVGEATRELIELLAVPGFSPIERATLITVIAACEEVIFRGLIPAPARARGGGWPTRAELLRIGASTGAYALTTAPLGSPLLMACALVCGSLWAAMRVTSGSLVVPVLAHTIWDLGVLLVWPLT